ncbi:MAG: transposase [Methanocalculaceae archaeon]|nr:transposase [Methanocalculaceae archaeon]
MFPDEEPVIDYFLKIRYPDGSVCPHCGEKYLVYQKRNIRRNLPENAVRTIFQSFARQSLKIRKLISVSGFLRLINW